MALNFAYQKKTLLKDLCCGIKIDGKVLNKEKIVGFCSFVAILANNYLAPYWGDDPQLNRANVNEATADLLRERMDASKSLFYVTTENAESSKWMPWECGYFDGVKEKVAILPIKQYSFNNEYIGQEYLGLYPYCLKQDNTLNQPRLWVYKSKEYYLVYEDWLKATRRDLKWKKAS